MATAAGSAASEQRSSSPRLPWRTRIAVSFLSLVTDTACRPDGTLSRRFLNALDLTSPANPNPVKGVKTFDVTVDPARKLWFRVFVPVSAAEAGTLPVVVFFHGGGFAFLSAKSKAYDAVGRRFARRLPAVVVSVNYRLSPEHRFPSQYDDGCDVLCFLDSNPRVLPEAANLSRCFLAGDSAGANLAHHVAVRAAGAGLCVVKLIGLISIQPFFGGEERTESELRLQNAPVVSVPRTDWMWKAFLPVGSNRDHWAANVCGPNAMDITNLEYPNTIVFVGRGDPLQDWQKRYYEWLKRNGKVAQLVEFNSFHAFYVFPELPEASQLISQVKDFVKKTLDQNENGAA